MRVCTDRCAYVLHNCYNSTHQRTRQRHALSPYPYALTTPGRTVIQPCEKVIWLAAVLPACGLFQTPRPCCAPPRPPSPGAMELRLPLLPQWLTRGTFSPACVCWKQGSGSGHVSCSLFAHTQACAGARSGAPQASQFSASKQRARRQVPLAVRTRTQARASVRAKSQGGRACTAALRPSKARARHVSQQPLLLKPHCLKAPAASRHKAENSAQACASRKGVHPPAPGPPLSERCSTGWPCPHARHARWRGTPSPLRRGTSPASSGGGRAQCRVGRQAHSSETQRRKQAAAIHALHTARACMHASKGAGGGRCADTWLSRSTQGQAGRQGGRQAGAHPVGHADMRDVGERGHGPGGLGVLVSSQPRRRHLRMAWRARAGQEQRVKMQSPHHGASQAGPHPL